MAESAGRMPVQEYGKENIKYLSSTVNCSSETVYFCPIAAIETNFENV